MEAEAVEEDEEKVETEDVKKKTVNYHWFASRRRFEKGFADSMIDMDN